MQQTETYKLNLIETSDPFSPQALNENTQKLEEVVHEKLGEMDQRVTVLEGHKFACGLYPPSPGDSLYVPLGFAPKFVLVRGINGGELAISVADENGKGARVTLNEDGFTVTAMIHSYYAYLAFG